MSWNHRVVRRVYPDAEVLYEIHEVYYNPDGTVDMMTVDGIDPIGEDLAGLRWTLEHMLRALEKPVLDYDTREEISGG